VRRGFLNGYQHWREETTNEVDKKGQKLPRPTTLNGEFSTIKRMWREVALAPGFITRDQLPEIPYAKTGKDQSFRRSSLSAEEWTQLERSARLYWIEGKSRYDEFGEKLGYHLISRGKNKGKESEKPVTRSTLYGVNRCKGTKQSRRATHQQIHREMLYLAMRISMESGIRIGSLRQMRWNHITENKTLSKEERKIWCVVEVPAENTKTGRWYELSAPITAHLERLKKITRPQNKNDLMFLNHSTGKPQSSRIWRDELLEMLVEAGLATWSADDSNNQRKAEIKSGKILTWYSFRHTWITFVLERGVPIATVCNNCDTSIDYIQQHYFHYDAKRATGALATGRKGLRATSD
jgi:integrase